MKKYFVTALAITSVLLFAGCEKTEKVEKGNYREGTYFASKEDLYGGSTNTATAVLVVDENGKIASLFLDTTYTSGETVTTKKSLGNDYNMKTYNQEAAGEWYEQVNALEDAVIAGQGLDGITLDEDGKTDSVTGCTITISAMYEAIQDALNQAKLK